MFAAVVDWRVAAAAAVVFAAAAILAVVTMRLLNAARPESPALVRLEVMSLRAWRRADGPTRASLLDAAEAEPITDVVRRVAPDRSSGADESATRRDRRLRIEHPSPVVAEVERDVSAELPVVDQVDWDDDWKVVARADDGDEQDVVGRSIDPLL